MLNECRARYGEVFNLQLGWCDCVFFNTPEAAKEVLDKQISGIWEPICFAGEALTSDHSFRSPRVLLVILTRCAYTSKMLQSSVTLHKVSLPMAHSYVMRDNGILPMSYTMKWRKMRRYHHRLMTPKASLAFVRSQEFEIKQLPNDSAGQKGKDSTDFYMYIRRMTFSIIPPMCR